MSLSLFPTGSSRERTLGNKALKCDISHRRNLSKDLHVILSCLKMCLVQSEINLKNKSFSEGSKEGSWNLKRTKTIASQSI